MKIALCQITWLSPMSTGWGNGYVVLDKGSKFDGKHYDEIPVDAHGGLTFSKRVDEDMLDKFEGLDKEDIGCWMIGFDTAHLGDTPSKWSKEDVKQEALKLLKEIEKEQGK